MATFDTIKAKLTALLNGANQTTGEADTNLTDAVEHLRAGYGKGAVLDQLVATENGIYYPQDGLDGFNRVDVIVEESGSDRYEEGYQSGYNDGESAGYNSGFSEGRSPEQSSSSVTVHTDSTKNFSVSFPAGYYPDNVSVSGTVGYTGGDLRLVTDQGTYQVGSKIFDGENLAIDLWAWAAILRQMIGQEYCYMPANITLPVNDGLAIINGAFIVDDPTADNCIIYFAGNDTTARYQLEMVIDPNTQQLTGLSVTKDGDAVDISGGLYMGMATYAFVIN